LSEFVGRLAPLSFALEQGVLMNILSVCFSVSQILYISMAIILRATTHVQKLLRNAGYPVIMSPMNTPRLVALFNCFNGQRVAF
jgi:hypothetical protein